MGKVKEFVQRARDKGHNDKQILGYLMEKRSRGEMPVGLGGGGRGTVTSTPGGYAPINVDPMRQYTPTQSSTSVSSPGEDLGNLNLGDMTVGDAEKLLKFHPAFSKGAAISSQANASIQKSKEETALKKKALQDKLTEEKANINTSIKEDLIRISEGQPKKKEVVSDNKYSSTIASAAKKHNVSVALLTALLEQESAFDEDVITGKRTSSAGAQGIAQFMPATAKQFGIDPLDPKQAIPAAAKYLKQNYDRFGSWDLALAAYNAGEGNVQKYGGIPPFKETQNYVKKIRSRAGY